jgi:competence protein ComFC
MPNCLWCENRAIAPPTWTTLFEIRPHPSFCEDCEGKLEVLTGKQLCQTCGRDLQLLQPLFYKNHTCLDCLKWKEIEWGKGLIRNRSLYTYNEFLKEVMAKYKFRGDALMIEAFRPALRLAFRRWYPNSVAVPIPLSNNRLKERTLNQSHLMATCMTTKVVHALIREGEASKQSKKSRQERLDIGNNPFKALPELKASIQGKSVVLIDDIYTTGVTLRLAALALQWLGPKSISSLTLARS